MRSRHPQSDIFPEFAESVLESEPRPHVAQDAGDGARELMRLTLQVAVPFRVQELKRWKGPSELDIERAREFSEVLGAKGDNLLFRSTRQGESAGLMRDLIHAVSVLAFMPGGITFLGLHFEAEP